MNYIIGLFLATSAFGLFALRWCFQQIHAASPNASALSGMVYHDSSQAHSVLAMFDATTGMQLQPDVDLGMTVEWRDDNGDTFEALCAGLGIVATQGDLIRAARPDHQARRTEALSGSIYIEATDERGEIIRQYRGSSFTTHEDVTLMTSAVELRDGAERQGRAFFCGIIAPWQLRVLKLLGVKPLRW